MKRVNVHTYRGEEIRNDKCIQQSNSLVYSELSFFEKEMYSGHYGVKLPIKGEETYIIEGQAFSIEDRHFLLTNPGRKTEILIKASQAVTGICIGLTEHFLNLVKSEMLQSMENMLDQKDNTCGNYFEVLQHRYAVDKSNHLASFLNNIKHQWKLYGNLDLFEEDQFYYDLGELIIRNQFAIEASIRQLQQNRTTVKEEIYRRVDIMDQYIHDEFQGSISMDDLSRIACLSKYHAIRCFQQIHGVSPYQKIMALRIEKAKSLLAKGVAISETAYLCGFSDYRGFSKHFKKKTGISPSKFRSKKH